MGESTIELIKISKKVKSITEDEAVGTILMLDTEEKQAEMIEFLKTNQTATMADIAKKLALIEGLIVD